MPERENSESLLRIVRRTMRWPTAEDRAERREKLRGYTLEALGIIKEGTVTQIRATIDQLHPVQAQHPWYSITQATPRQAKKILQGLEAEGAVESRKVRKMTELHRINNVVPPEITLWRKAQQK